MRLVSSLIARSFGRLTLTPTTSLAMLLCAASLMGGGIATFAAMTDSKAIGGNSFSTDALSKHLGVSTAGGDSQLDTSTAIATGAGLTDLALDLGTTPAGHPFTQVFKVTNSTATAQRAKLITSDLPAQIATAVFDGGGDEQSIPAGGFAWVKVTSSMVTDGTSTSGKLRLAYDNSDVNSGTDTTSRWMYADFPVAITNRPAAPTDFTATPRTAAAPIDLAWTASTTTGVDGYDVYRKTGAGSYTKINPSTVTGTTYADVSAVSGTAYTYVIRTVHGALTSVDSQTATATSATVNLAPDAPATLTATPKPAGAIDLSWAASTTPAVDGYRVYRATTAGGPYTQIGSLVTGTTYTDSTGTNGTTYYYVVRAVKTALESSNSLQAAATSDSSAPAPTVTSPANNSSTQSRTPSLSGAAGTAANDNGTVKVEIFSGATATGTALQTFIEQPVSSGAWTVSSVSSLADGQYTVRVVQADLAGNSGSATSTITVDDTNPTPAVTTPADGGFATSKKPAISGTASSAAGDATTVTVKIFAGIGTTGTLKQTFTSVPVSSGAWSVPAGWSGVPGTPNNDISPDGAYTVEVVQGDAAGNSGSDTNGFTLDSSVPTMTKAEMFDADKNGIVDTIEVTFSEAIANPGSAASWYIENSPTGNDGITVAPTASGSVVTLKTTGTAVLTSLPNNFHVGINASGTITDAAGNAAVATTNATEIAVADKAAPVPTAITDKDTGTTGNGLFQVGDHMTITFSETMAVPADTTADAILTGGTATAEDTFAAAGYLGTTAGLTSGGYIAGDGAKAQWTNSTISRLTGGGNTNQIRLQLSGTCTSVTTAACTSLLQVLTAAAVTIAPDGTNLKDQAGNGAVQSSTNPSFSTRLF